MQIKDQNFHGCLSLNDIESSQDITQSCIYEIYLIQKWFALTNVNIIL